MHAMKTKGWMGTVALAALLGATGCSKNEGDGGGGGGSSFGNNMFWYSMGRASRRPRRPPPPPPPRATSPLWTSCFRTA